MSDYTVTKLDEIDEISDGRCPWRPVRHQFGITAFCVNAFTGKEVGDRIINEHDEAGEHDLQESFTSSTAAARGSSSAARASTRRPAHSSTSRRT